MGSSLHYSLNCFPGRTEKGDWGTHTERGGEGERREGWRGRGGEGRGRRETEHGGGRETCFAHKCLGGMKVSILTNKLDEQLLVGSCLVNLHFLEVPAHSLLVWLARLRINQLCLVRSEE